MSKFNVGDNVWFETEFSRRRKLSHEYGKILRYEHDDMTYEVGIAEELTHKIWAHERNMFHFTFKEGNKIIENTTNDIYHVISCNYELDQEWFLCRKQHSNEQYEFPLSDIRKYVGVNNMKRKFNIGDVVIHNGCSKDRSNAWEVTGLYETTALPSAGYTCKNVDLCEGRIAFTSENQYTLFEEESFKLGDIVDGDDNENFDGGFDNSIYLGKIGDMYLIADGVRRDVLASVEDGMFFTIKSALFKYVRKHTKKKKIFFQGLRFDLSPNEVKELKEQL